MHLNSEYADFFKQLTLDQIFVLESVVQAFEKKESIADLSRKIGGRDIASYTRTIRRINDQSQRYFGEPALIEPFKKGAPWTCTMTGKLLANFCTDLRRVTENRINEIEKLVVERPIRIAMPQLPLMDLLKIEDIAAVKLSEMNSSRRFEKQLFHIRSEELPTVLLDDPTIDYAFGGLITPGTLDESLEFLEIENRHYNIISNFNFEAAFPKAKNDPINIEFLRKEKVPLIIAHIGVIVDCLLSTLNIERNRREDIRKYLTTIRQHYNIVEECNDVHFMIELLCTARQQLCMFGTDDIFMRAENRVASEEIQDFWRIRQGKPPIITYHEVTSALPPLRVGVLRRRSKEPNGPSYGRDHPIRIFWEIVQEIASADERVSGC